MATPTINAARVGRLVRGWNNLRRSTLTTDWDIACFFQAERYRRKNYRGGRAGDEQFKDDVNRSLRGISGAKALRYAAFKSSYTQERWIALGGYESINYIEKLDCSADTKGSIKRAVITHAESQGQPATRGMVRNIALRFNVRLPVQTNVSTLLEKRNLLAQFIYDELGWDIPAEIILAMPQELQQEYRDAGITV